MADSFNSLNLIKSKHKDALKLNKTKVCVNVQFKVDYIRF